MSAQPTAPMSSRRAIKPHVFVAPKSYRQAKVRRVKPETRCARCRVQRRNHLKIALPILPQEPA